MYGPVEYASMPRAGVSRGLPAYADLHCAPCAHGYRAQCAQGCDPRCDGQVPCGSSRSAPMAPGVAAAMALLDARAARWAAEEEERYLRAYVQAGIEARRPDPAGCMRSLLRRRRRWLEQEHGR